MADYRLRIQEFVEHERFVGLQEGPQTWWDTLDIFDHFPEDSEIEVARSAFHTRHAAATDVTYTYGPDLRIERRIEIKGHKMPRWKKVGEVPLAALITDTTNEAS